MDTLSNETILALNNIAETINTPRPYDWAMFFVTFFSLIAFVVLTIFIYRTNKSQGDRQIELQKNAQRINLFDKYSAIYVAFNDDIANLEIYEFALQANPQIFDAFKDISGNITSVISTAKLLLTEKEGIALGCILNHIGRIQKVIHFISQEAIKQNVVFNVDFNGTIGGLKEQMECVNRHSSEAFYSEIRRLSLANENAINHIKQNKAAIKKILEESNLQQALENYCNINNILKD